MSALRFGAPPDAVAWTALAVALALVVSNIMHARGVRPLVVSDRTFVAALAALAALLSAGYVFFYLRGGPRIVDATSYYLQARALSEGHVRMPIAPLPMASFIGRFLLGSGDGTALSVIFPPGYPAVLALGFLLRAPLAVGPVLAAGLVVATFALSRRMFDDVRVARLAAVLSAICAVLRYHTADTMSHGLSALLFAAALWASRGSGRGAALAAGCASGFLFATRPVTGVLCLALVLAASRRRDRWSAVVAGASIPMVAFLGEQRVATGAWFTSTQAAYYALADSPVDCFRYGFGSGIGCKFEHGDFVRAHLEHGYGLFAALGTTLRRLKMHLSDAGNIELSAPVLVYALVLAFRERKGRALACGVLGMVAAYAPFYFDGNYPAGGARFYADALPLEHVLIAFALVELRAASLAAPAALLGFAVHTSYDHRQLAEREGGRPMFERQVLEARGVNRGLVFVSTDHGFNLAFDPRALSRAGDLVVARRRGDGHDALLWEALGRPDAYEYSYDPSADRASPDIRRLPVTELATDRFEAESAWPPLRVSGGSVLPSFPPCASRGRALWIVPQAPGTPAVLRLPLPVAPGQNRRLVLGWVAPSGAVTAAEVTVGRARFPLRSSESKGCAVTQGPEVEVRGGEFLEVSSSGELGIDFFELRSPSGH